MATVKKIGVTEGDPKSGIYVVEGSLDNDILKRPLTTGQLVETPNYSSYFQKMGAIVRDRATRNAVDQAGGALTKLGSMVDIEAPKMHNPLFNYLNFYVPSSRQNMNAYIRYYDLFHPLIRNGVSLLTELIMPDFDFTTDDSSVSDFFNEMKEETDLYRAMRAITKEYTLFGDSIDYWRWDEDYGYYTDIDTSLINEMWHIIKVPLVIGDQATQYFYDQFGVDTFRKTFELLPNEIQDEIRNEMDPGIWEASEERKMLHIEPFNLTMVTNNDTGDRGISKIQSCFVAGTQIIVKDGTTKSIEDVEVGDEVYSHTRRLRKVIDTVDRKYDGDIYTIEVDGISGPVECTSDHKLYVWTGNEHCSCGCGTKLTANNRKQQKFFASTNCWRKYCSENGITPKYDSFDRGDLAEDTFEWREAQDLTTEDYLCIPVGNNNTQETEVSPDKARLFGYYLAEGCIHKECNVKFYFHSDEKEYVEDVRNILREEYEIDTSLTYPTGVHKGANFVIVTALASKGNCKKFMEDIDHYCGRYSHKKRLAEEIMSWPSEQKIQLLVGLIRGDGCWKDSRINHVTVSKHLSDQVSFLMYDLNVIHRQRIVENPGKNRRPAYHINVFNTQDCVLFNYFVPIKSARGKNDDSEWANEVIDIITTEKGNGFSFSQIACILNTEGIQTARGKEWTKYNVQRVYKQGSCGYAKKRPYSKRMKKGEYIVNCITNIITKEEETIVYNFTVEGDYSYLLSEQIASKNCTKELLYEDILRYSQWKIAEKRAGATRLWKLGSDTFPATEEWIMDFAEMMEELDDGVVPEMFMPHNIAVEDVGIAGKTLNIIQELQFVEDRILTALGINKAMTRAEGPAYAPSAIAYSIVRARVTSERENILDPVNSKMAVVSIVNDYHDVTPAERKHGIRKDGRKRKMLRRAISELQSAEWFDPNEAKYKLKEYKTALVKYAQDNKSKRADNTYGDFIVPDVVFHDRIKLEADKERYQRAEKLFLQGLFPFKTLLEMGGWEFDEIVDGLERQAGSISDPVIRQAYTQVLTKLYGEYFQGVNAGEAVTKPKGDMGFGDQPASITPGGGGAPTGLRPQNTPIGELPTGEAPITEVPEPPAE